MQILLFFFMTNIKTSHFCSKQMTNSVCIPLNKKCLQNDFRTLKIHISTQSQQSVIRVIRSDSLPADPWSCNLAVLNWPREREPANVTTYIYQLYKYMNYCHKKKSTQSYMYIHVKSKT